MRLIRSLMLLVLLTPGLAAAGRLTRAGRAALLHRSSARRRGRLRLVALAALALIA